MSFKELNPYQMHQKLINDYILKRPGDTKKLYMRDTSKDKTDIDVIRENHRFLWSEDDVDSWEKQLANFTMINCSKSIVSLIYHVTKKIR